MPEHPKTRAYWDERDERGPRALKLALATLGGATAAGFTAVIAFQLLLPLGDRARGLPLGMVLLAPPVRWMFAIAVLFGAFITYPFALAILWRTRLRKSVPIVIGTGAIAAALCAPFHLLEVLPVFGATLAAMVVCREKYPTASAEVERE